MRQGFGMGSILRFFGGVLLAAFIVIVTLARLAIEIVGASTTPDDFALLKQRMPAMFSWLFSTPWWVPTALLFGASGAAAWLIWSGTKRAAAHEMQEHDALDEQTIAAIIESRLAQIPAPERQTDLATHADLHAHDVKIAELSDRVKFVRELVEGSHEAQEARFKKIEDKLDLVVAYAEKRTGELSERFGWIDYGFAAILNREWHERLFTGLGEDFARIAKPIDAKEEILDFARWQMLLTNWRGKLDQWLVIAEYYAMNTRENVLMIPDHLYYGNWSIAEDKLTADQVKMFKEASIWWQSAKAAKPRVDQCLAAAAFESPSKKGQLDTPPRPSANR